MPTSPIEAEATGQELVTAEYGGHEWTIPLDVETWPVDLLTDTVIVSGEQTLIHRQRLTAVLRSLLGAQWRPFLAVAPKRRDLLPASHAFAAAVGMPSADRVDIAFGAIPRLVRELEWWPGPVEATLRAAGLDYRDRYLFTAGRRRLTLRQIHVALEHAAWDSPIALARNGGRRPFSDEAIAVMDLYEAITGTAYYRRPLSPEARSQRENATQKAVADYKKRHTNPAPQERQKSAAETARTNAQFAKQREASAHAS